MRRLGLLGGMSWESTALYYRAINQHVAARRGGLHSAPLVLHSVDFAPLAAWLAVGEWGRIETVLCDAARGLRAAGAQGLVMATNTMHKLAPAIEQAAGLPLLHIADATGQALKSAGVVQVALLGTRPTMEEPAIVQQRLAERFGISVRVPDEADRIAVNRIVFDELCRGEVRATSRQAYVDVITRLQARGAQAVILGCTEITMLIDATVSPLPVFDSTALHAAAAADWLLADGL
jgi:aspartate racemase